MIFFSKLKMFSLTQHREKFNKHIFENERDCNDKVDNTFFERKMLNERFPRLAKTVWKAPENSISKFSASENPELINFLKLQNSSNPWFMIFPSV